MSFDPHIALDTSRSVVVEACAGSGKTWLLSSRIARALVEGVPPRSILALTFTNKAAAEMRNRVVGHLKEMATCDAHRLDEKLMEWGFQGEGLKRARKAAPGALAAYLTDPQPPVISTFHSWYSRLAAMAPLSMAGAATMALSTRPWDLMRQAWQLFFTDHLQRVPYNDMVKHMGAHTVRQAMEAWVYARVEWQAFADHVQSLNATTDDVQKSLAQMAAENDQAINRFYETHRDRAALLAQAYAGAENRDDFFNCLTHWQPDQLDQLRRALLTTLKSKEQWESGRPRRFRLKGGDDKFVRKADLKRWGSKADQLQQDVFTLANGLMELLDQIDDRWVRVRTQALWCCGKALADGLGQVMARQHEIDFSGLESVAWELMGGVNAAEFHARLDTRVQHILVDEFQDTNPTQWGMLRAWLEQYRQSDVSVAADAPEVFLVGDPKQSIYRFRRADPQVFAVASDWLKQHYQAAVLKANATRRCGPDVVRFLNACMPTIARDRFDDHESLAQQHAQGDVSGFVKRLPIAADSEQEGMQIAQALTAIRRDHPEIAWKDVRVLVRARTNMAHYEKAFSEAGIPFVSDRLGGLLKTPEVRDLMALLRCLAFPWSAADRAQVAASPMLSLPDSQGEPSQSIPKDWFVWADELPVHDLLDRIIHQQDLLNRFAGRYYPTRGLQCLANIEAFVALALELDTGRLPSLTRFIQELNRLENVRDADAPALGVMPAVDAVSLSSLHSAKGLEAAVVVMAGLLDRDKADKGLRWLIDWNSSRDQILGVTSWQAGDPFNDTVVRALTDDRRQAKDEDFNLLYVGATRAKRFLVFSAAEGAKESDDKWFTQISGHCDEWLPDASCHAQRSDKSPSTSLQSSLTWPGQDFPPRVIPPAAPLTANPLAIRQGKALHRLLEFGLALPDSAIARLMAPFALPRSARDEIHASLATLRQSSVVRDIFRADRRAYSEAEWPIQNADGFALIRPDRVVQMSTDPDVWWIVDFKWQVLRSEMSDYAAQLAAYQKAFEAIRPQAVVQAKILTAQAEVWQLLAVNGTSGCLKQIH